MKPRRTTLEYVVVSSWEGINVHYPGCFIDDRLGSAVDSDSWKYGSAIFPVTNVDESLTINEACKPSILPIRASTLVHVVEDELS